MRVKPVVNGRIDPTVALYNRRILSVRDPFQHEREQDLDVPDLRLDL